MQSVLAAETAILIHFESVGIVLFVFLRIVVTLLAFAASESDLYSHSIGTSLKIRGHPRCYGKAENTFSAVFRHSYRASL